MTPAHTSCARPLRIPPPGPHAAPHSGQVIGHAIASHRKEIRAAPSSFASERARNSASPRASGRHETEAESVRLQILKQHSDIRHQHHARSRSRQRTAARPIAVIQLLNRSVTVQRVARITAMSTGAAVAERRHATSPQLHSHGKFDAVARGENGGTCPPGSHRLSRYPESTTQRGLV